ncbi:MAG: NnrS family protein, partial [bacterium]
MLILDSDTPARHPGMPLFNLGFRPFFLGAGIFAVLSIGIWVAAYTAGVNPYPQQLPAMWWHIHEMLFGYAAAVIAGFLLTATKNWTDEQTPHQLPLAGLFLCWAAPRLLLFWDQMLWLAAILDVVFNLWLLWAIALPILKTRCKKQYPILGKIVFLFICNGLFYGEALNFWGGVAYQVLYLTLLVVLGLILMMSRRLIPFFIERGVGQPVTLKNSVAVDIACMVLYLAFVVLSFLSVEARVHAALCVTLALALGLRAIWWHHPGIWHRPLLWSLLVAYGFIVLGFVAYAASLTGLIASSLAIH